MYTQSSSYRKDKHSHSQLKLVLDIKINKNISLGNATRRLDAILILKQNKKTNLLVLKIKIRQD